jgi:diguanylate cyclase (GGDEF)-like protein/PAS domain S-box-containing protein
MLWLKPAIAFSAMASVLLAATFAYTWAYYLRRRYALLWAAAWSAAFPHLALTYWLLDDPSNRALWSLSQLFLVGNAFLIVSGCLDFARRRVRVALLLGLVSPFVLWAFLAPYVTDTFLQYSLPNSILLGGSYLWASSLFFRLYAQKKPGGARLVGVLLALAGLHEFDYPLLGQMPGAAPIGYSLAAGLMIAIALCLIVMMLEQARSEADEERLRIRAILDNLPVGVLVTSPRGEIILANEFARRITGAPAQSLSEIEKRLFGNGDDPPPVSSALRSGVPTPAVEFELAERDGVARTFLVNAAPVTGHDSDTLGAVAVFQDTTQARKLSAQLSYQATHDSLTGLLNRLEFERQLDLLVEDAQSQGREHALCYMDLDQFKLINDTCGHIAGDELLRQISVQLRTGTRKADSLARLGGDEFGLLVRDCALEDAGIVAELLRSKVEELPFSWDERTFHLTTSIGVAPISASSDSAVGVLSDADAACYLAKDLGRNRVQISLVDDEDLVRRHGEMEWVARINRALEEERFFLVGQPIVPLKLDRSSAEMCEVLLRMTDEEGLTVEPGAFLPAAERYQLSAKLDRWVIDCGLRWLARRRELNQPPIVCSFNLSGSSLDEGFLNYARDRLEHHQVAPETVCFEITETVAIRNLAAAGHLIRELGKLGCRFALDDFGSGLSSFAYLKNLPVDLVKIDGLFIRRLSENRLNQTIVSAICEIGRVMGKETVAEKVEDSATLETLGELGVDYAQGYGIAVPRPLEEFPPELLVGDDAGEELSGP